MVELNALPDDILLKVLGLLKCSQRLGAASLVCRRWHGLCHTPALLRRVSASSLGQLLRVQALSQWLLKYSGKVQQLALDVTPVPQSATVRGAVCHYLSQCMTTIAAGAPALTHLAVSGELLALFRTEDWLVLPNTLHHLLLDSPVRDCRWVEPAAGLEWARLTDCIGVSLEPLFRLKKLRSLELFSMMGVPPAALSGLTQLEYLRLSNSQVPASLAVLTQLQGLRLEFPTGASPTELFSNLQAALAALTQLTALEIRTVRNLGGQLPVAELAALPLLQRCTLLELAGDAEAAPTLLPGPWQHSLESLVADWALLGRSQAFLSGATRLKWLHVESDDTHLIHEDDMAAEDDPGAAALSQLRSAPFPKQAVGEAFWQWFWAWLQHHPALRRLSYNCYDFQHVPCTLMDAIADLCRSKPSIVLQRLHEWNVVDELFREWGQHVGHMANLRFC